MVKRITVAGQLLLFVVIIYFPLFLHLGNLSIRDWDEARLIANAQEMFANCDFIVTRYNGLPDLWNTKPPLMIWAQVFFLNIMGDSEITFRMPSAIAGAFTAMFILFLTIKYYKSYWFGLIITLVLITSTGYVGYHVTRTGDYDALLTLFTTISSLSIFLYTEHKKHYFLHLFFIGLILAVLTKSIQGLIFVPGIFIYIIVTRNLKNLLTNKWLYINSVVFLLVIGGYYLYRESLNPGYLEAVWFNELGGRYLNTIEYHNHPFNYYFKLLYESQFSLWIAFYFIGFALAFTFEDKRITRLVIYSAFLSIFYLVVISLSKTKLAWYTAPAFPLLAVVCGAGIYRIYLFINNAHISYKEYKLNKLIAFLMLVMFFYTPYNLIFDTVYKPKDKDGALYFYSLNNYLQNAANSDKNLKGYSIITEEYSVHLKYYVKKLRAKGSNIRFKKVDALNAGDKVIIDRRNIAQQVETKYNANIIETYNNVTIYAIVDKK